MVSSLKYTNTTNTMDINAMPDDFFVTAGAFTKKLYRDQYPAI